MLCILVTGEPLAETLEKRGDFVTLIREAVGEAWDGPWASVDLRNNEVLPDLGDVGGLVVTGSPASVTDRDAWEQRGEAYLRDAVRLEVPTFGICFGHQMLAAALGGRVERNPRGREIGTVEVELVVPDPIFDGLEPPLLANQTHVDSVVTVPDGATVLARTRLDPHAAVRFGPRAWGVQFHPEVDGEIMRHYIDARFEQIRDEGLPVEALRRDARDGRAGTGTLRRFIEVAVKRRD